MNEKTSSAATYGGSGVAGASGVGLHLTANAADAAHQALVWGLTPSEWSVVGVLGGLVIGLAGCLTNLYFQWKRSKR